ncbi:agglutinin biogenesis protein MshJ [Alteromonas sp. 1_MG-2023]|uniref:agglutinin biogenesis protein MshJ n=1 Tax=Alteromonas sp. 1_MG-2023 TaxID=3062669 RepID=UPI0026E396F4|nr:agglutinin biogenesis protein MshJ [Alteromonas sp. 1_MG-2023]MDO6566686.1 agglutinin biogenesis protein MshJ [Alteromonas sp. 1_MG-2023]
MSQWQQLSDKFSGLQPREKNLIFYGSLALLIYLFIWVGITTQLDTLDSLNKVHQKKLSEEKALLIKRDALHEALSIDYKKRVQSDIDKQLKALIAIDEKLKTLDEGFVAADRMPELLMTLLNQQDDVSLINFQVDATQAIRFGDGEEQSAVFYRHNMTLVIEGGFFAVRAYLASLQNADEKVVVTAFDYEVGEYPSAKLTMQLATVSNNETFISL